MNKTASIIITIALATALGIIFFGQSNNGSGSRAGSAQNVEIKDGIQYVTIKAVGGYSPNISTAQANIPTKLIIKTNGTYDCSSALVIQSIGYQKVLQQTAEEIIDIGTKNRGESLQGLCSMGMYGFLVNFN